MTCWRATSGRTTQVRGAVLWACYVRQGQRTAHLGTWHRKWAARAHRTGQGQGVAIMLNHGSVLMYLPSDGEVHTLQDPACGYESSSPGMHTVPQAVPSYSSIRPSEGPSLPDSRAARAIAEMEA